MKKLLFIGLILISLLCLYAHSEDFVIGNYSYLKKHYSYFNQMAQKMGQANFNATIWEPSDTNNDVEIDTLYSNGINSFLYDQITNYDSDGDISAISLRNLSMGNFYQFDAEYDSLSTLNDSNDEYFYKFNITRPSYPFPLSVHNHTWKCTPSPTSPDGGVIIDQLTYRWQEYYVGNNNSVSNGKPLKTIGPEFQFAYHLR